MLDINNIHKSYEGQPLLAGISFSISAGETICLLGPSGSGKSTLLRIIAGLETPDLGRVSWAGQDLSDIPVHQRGFGLVFQDYALFPHLNVARNVAFGLKMQNLGEAEVVLRVAEVMELVNLNGFENRRVADLSGGEQQRVALGRALAPRPRLLMFDEPLGALDRNLREQLMEQLRRILHESAVPAIYVTHDQEEAFTLADRVLLLHDGGIVSSGPPQQVWNDPGSVWAAKFLDAGNVVAGTVLAGTKPTRVETSVGVFLLDCETIKEPGFHPKSPQGSGDHNHYAGEKVNILINRYGARQAVDGRVGGVVVDVVFRQDGFKVSLESGLAFYLPQAPRVGEKISIEIPTAAVRCLS